MEGGGWGADVKYFILDYCNKYNIAILNKDIDINIGNLTPVHFLFMTILFTYRGQIHIWHSCSRNMSQSNHQTHSRHLRTTCSASLLGVPRKCCS